MRVPLQGGQWAELRDRLTYAQARDVRLAYFAAQQDATAQADYDLTIVRAFVTAWEVNDFDGNPVSLDRPELAPDETIQLIFAAGTELVANGAMGAPKAGGAPSLTSLPVRQSRSRAK